MFYSVSMETKQTILIQIFRCNLQIANKTVCFPNFVYDVVDLVNLQLKM